MAKVFPKVIRMFFNFRLLAINYGQWRSINEGKAINVFGEPIPWYTYPAIEYLNQFDFSEKNIFEFGSGNSSLYWASRVKSVVSVESDPAWYDIVKNSLKSNQKLMLRQDGVSHVNSLAELGMKFDIIVIDGNWRRNCAHLAVDYLKSGGIVILDNSDWYPNTATDLRSNGFFQINFSGFGPINNYTWTTSIFIQQFQDLQINFKNVLPIGGIVQSGSDDR